MLNPNTDHISPQYHLTFDDNFTTVNPSTNINISSIWKGLYKKNAYISNYDTEFSLDDTTWNLQTTKINNIPSNSSTRMLRSKGVLGTPRTDNESDNSMLHLTDSLSKHASSSCVHNLLINTFNKHMTKQNNSVIRTSEGDQSDIILPSEGVKNNQINTQSPRHTYLADILHQRTPPHQTNNKHNINYPILLHPNFQMTQHHIWMNSFFYTSTQTRKNIMFSSL